MVLTPLAARRSIMTPLGHTPPSGVGAAYSLYFDGGDDVDCGNDPTVMDLHQAPCTIDAYWRCPALTDLKNWTMYTLVAQGQWSVAGWDMLLYTQTLPSVIPRFYWRDGGDANRWINLPAFDLVEGNWYYFRARKADASTFYFSVNAGAEASAWGTAGGTASASNLLIAQTGGDTQHLEGNICYVHLWDSDQGSLGAVPTSPFAAAGVARYIFSEGAGGTLSDTSGEGNNGTINGAEWTDTIPPGWAL